VIKNVEPIRFVSGLFGVIFNYYKVLQGIEMRIFHHIPISACIHSSRGLSKTTTRKAYAKL